MNFRKFYKKSTFELVAIGNSNWDLYVISTPNCSDWIVAIAKPDSGAKDCYFCSTERLLRKINTNDISGYAIVGGYFNEKKIDEH